MKHFKFKLMDCSLKKALDADLILCPHPGLCWLFEASFITLPFEWFFLHVYSFVKNRYTNIISIRIRVLWWLLKIVSDLCDPKISKNSAEHFQVQNSKLIENGRCDRFQRFPKCLYLTKYSPTFVVISLLKTTIFHRSQKICFLSCLLLTKGDTHLS